ncbi:MAG: hypothetical protein HC840_22170 [Leptolyngbyaceae cyanobacterium RM2_2_4]|nr:hypothetical protein [Leptolyngbyaceae cyanobacterium RM2_2_4]
MLAEQRLHNLAIPPHRQPPEASRLTPIASHYCPHPYLLSVLQHHPKAQRTVTTLIS